MDNDVIDLKAKIFYYLMHNYYHSMIGMCKEGITKFKSDGSFHLYHALALMLNHRLEESVNELDLVKNENGIKLSAVIALMYTHKLLKSPNKELFQKLDSQSRDLRKSAEAIDFYHSALVLFAFNKPEKAIDYLDKSLNMQSDLHDAVRLKGWILLTLKKRFQRSVPNITDIFETSMSNNKRNLDATLGLIECYLSQNKIEEALNTVNKAIIRFPTSHLPLILKMKIQFASHDWEQAIETMNRISNDCIEDTDALKTNILIMICRDANYTEAVVCIKRFVTELEAKEPKNSALLLSNAQLFSRTCGRHIEVLTETYKMVEKAIQVDSEDVQSIIELGYHSLLLRRVREAQKYFKTATRLDESSLNALMGLTLCELSENGKSDQIKKQVDFLLELEEAQNSPRLYLIRAQIAENSEEALLFLKKACDLQLNFVRFYSYSDEYLHILDPDFLLDVVKEYLKHVSCSTDASFKNSNKKKSNVIANIQNILKIITKACPGLYEPLFLLAKLQYFCGETNDALQTLEQILLKVDDEASCDAHLLMAQIQVQSGYYERAAQSLEVCLSHSFKVRENPLYHFIKGMVEKNTNNLPDAIKSLTTALSLINIYPQTTSSASVDQQNLTLTEKASIYIELIEVHNLIGQADEATKLLEDTVEEFQGSPEETRILVLSADNAIKKRDIQGAINLLNKVKSTDAYYLQARTKMADVLLKYRMDKFAYLQCYQEVVDDNPGSESYLLLGDAYMTILEPDDALDCYKLALQQNPKDAYLISKMGKALIETHYFTKAVSFYKESIKSTNNSELKLQLADLYMQLKEYSKAEVLLMTEIEGESQKNEEDLTYLQFKTKLLMLLAQTQEKSGKMSASLSTLKDAKDNQNRVRKRLAVEQTSVPEEEIKLLLDIGVKLAETSSFLKNNDQAIQFYKDALEVSPTDTNILAALANLYMQMNVLDPCQQICGSILRIDPENETASVMMADIAFRKIDFDMALFHFTQLITKQPTNWTALVRLVELLKRTGNVQDAPDYLKNAQNFSSNSQKDPGFLFSSALYQWYSGNLNQALRNFNGARQDSVWGHQALYNMIEICLNPGDELLGDQFMENEDTEYRDSRSMALKTAEKLLRELKQRLEASGSDLLRYNLLVNFRLLATQERHNIERGLEDFISIASQNAYKDHVGPILGMATAYSLLKQSQRAKNQLKRVAKTSWTFEDADYLERCWLLLSDYYIQSSKFDVAGDLLNKVVQHNKACSRAYEYLGFIAEKEQRHKDAVTYYESAWRHGGKSNAGTGYKLTHSLMKCKNYAEAIDIAHQVLKLSPDFPKIKKEILDKAMNNLRV